MSAKPAKKSPSPTARPATPAPNAASEPVAAMASASSATAPVAWFDSSDPRKRMFGRIILVGVWLYVAALWLLALDQTFHLGIFGPTVPPMP